MYQRQITDELKALAKDYPVVTVVGPRQSEKTTLVQHVFPKKRLQSVQGIQLLNFRQAKHALL